MLWMTQGYSLECVPMVLAWEPHGHWVWARFFFWAARWTLAEAGASLRPEHGTLSRKAINSRRGAWQASCLYLWSLAEHRGLDLTWPSRTLLTRGPWISQAVLGIAQVLNAFEESDCSRVTTSCPQLWPSHHVSRSSAQSQHGWQWAVTGWRFTNSPEQMKDADSWVFFLTLPLDISIPVSLLPTQSVSAFKGIRGGGCLLDLSEKELFSID